MCALKDLIGFCSSFPSSAERLHRHWSNYLESLAATLERSNLIREPVNILHYVSINRLWIDILTILKLIKQKIIEI